MNNQTDPDKGSIHAANEINKYLPDYLSALSHEIRTPLNAIIGFSGLLMENGVARTDQEYYSRLINRNSRRLLDIMTNLVDLARIETGKVDLFPYPVTISRMVDDLRKESAEIRKAIGKEEVKIEFNSRRKGAETILLDWTRFFRILKILIENGLKYTEKGSVVVDFEKDAPANLIVRITDQGPGMDEDTVKRLFNLFPSAPLNEDAGIRSRGLGMLVVKKTCDLMNIGIEVESRINSGTTFTLSVHP